MQFPVAFVALAASLLSVVSAAPVADASNHKGGSEIDISIRINECHNRGSNYYWSGNSCHYRNNNDHHRGGHKGNKNHYIREASPEAEAEAVASNHKGGQEVDIEIIIRQCHNRGSNYYWSGNSCHYRNNDNDHHKGGRKGDKKHYIREASPEASPEAEAVASNHKGGQEVDIEIKISQCHSRGSNYYWSGNSCHYRKQVIDIEIKIKQCHNRGSNYYWSGNSCQYRKQSGNGKHYIRDAEVEEVAEVEDVTDSYDA
jgi:hypothetical protein